MSQFMDEEGTPTKNSLYMNTGQAEDPWYTQGESPTAEYANNNNQSFDYNTNNYNNNIAEEGPEEPLLEELGVNFDKIWVKTQAVLYPTKRISTHILDDADLAGPLCFCLLLGACLLFSGKVQFGYIYGFSVFGCLSLQAIMNLIHPVGLDFWRTCSVLGYCLLPVIALAAVGVVVRLKGLLGLVLAAGAIGWSTMSATRLIDAKLTLTELYWLVAYPIMLLYSCFVIITIF